MTPPLTLFSREKDNNAETAANRALNRDHQGGDSTKRLLIQRCGWLASLDESQWPLSPRKAEPKVLVRETSGDKGQGVFSIIERA